MKKTISLLSMFLISVSLLSTGCDKDEAVVVQNTTKYNLSGTASSAQEVPANASTATGSLTGTYDATTNSLTYSVSWSGLTSTATGGHFHGPALAGTNASVVVPFTLNNSGTGGNASGTRVLTDPEEVDLLAGKWYYNIHTAGSPGGEIRSQVIMTLQ
jgi:hypothetical protein